MQKFIFPALLALATPALAETDVSALIGERGLAAAEAALAALPQPTPSEAFALGGVQFLTGVERALQTRYRIGIATDMAIFIDLPILRLPIEENPTPDPFRPSDVTDLFAAVLADMTRAAATLEAVPGDVSLRINTGDIWFDINMNGTREPGESMAAVAGISLRADLSDVTVAFDTADVQWLRAYAHLLAGLSEAVLAFDPTAAIDRIQSGSAALQAINAANPAPDYGYSYDREIGPWVDYAAIVLTAIQVRPDAEHSRAAQAHLLATVQANREFWRLVSRETDNDAEWIPNKAQDSALGIDFPDDTGTRWLAVLSEAEAVLRGEALIPYWRLGAGAGINLNAILQNPPTIDLIGLIQGTDLVPYAETGRVMSFESLDLFMRMAGGDAGLFMVIIN